MVDSANSGLMVGVESGSKNNKKTVANKTRTKNAAKYPDLPFTGKPPELRLCMNASIKPHAGIDYNLISWLMIQLDKKSTVSEQSPLPENCAHHKALAVTDSTASAPFFNMLATTAGVRLVKIRGFANKVGGFDGIW